MVLSACGELCEMLLHGKNTMLAGNLIMNEYMPLTMKKVACRRGQNAENAKAELQKEGRPLHELGFLVGLMGGFPKMPEFKALFR